MKLAQRGAVELDCLCNTERERKSGCHQHTDQTEQPRFYLRSLKHFKIYLSKCWCFGSKELVFLLRGCLHAWEVKERFPLRRLPALLQMLNAKPKTDLIQSWHQSVDADLFCLVFIFVFFSSVFVSVAYVHWYFSMQDVYVHLPGWTCGPDAVWNLPGSGVTDGMICHKSAVLFSHSLKLDSNVFLYFFII